MKKILYIITQSEFGGAQRYVFDLAKNLDKSQYEILVVAGGDGELFGVLEAQKIPYLKLKYLRREIRPCKDILAYFEIKKIIKKFNPEIIHLNSSKAGFLGSFVAKKLKVQKIIYTAHGFAFNEPLGKIKKWIYKKAEISNSKRADFIIAVSDFDRDSGIKAGIAKDKILTIHNGIDADIAFFERNEARKKLEEIKSVDNSDKKPLIGCIANLYPTKGIEFLIKAMKNIDANLFILGDGILRTKLEKMTKDLNLEKKIFFLGYIKNASIYLKAFDVFVLPSLKEGLPYAILEAKTASIPIVASRTGGVPELIQDKQTGYLAEPENSEELAEAINKCLTKPIKPKLEHQFTIKEMINNVIKIYEK
jgi:glycosyltransferase involved in cell wall biosynthesis